MRFTRLLSTILGFLVLTPLAARATTEITVGKARFQFISPTCVRMEYAPDGKFIDLPSIIAINRKFPNVGAGGSREIKDGEQTHIVVDGTEFTMNIIYIKGHAFDDQSLSIFMPPSTMCGGVGVGWKPSMVDDRNLGGTVSSLDGATGAQDMGMGLLSRNGWHVIDDSKSALLTPDGWFKKRETAEGYQDWVFFGYGHDYKQAFADFRAVCGAIPPLPAWAFGLWYSRYWTYSDQELRDIVTRFKTEGIPLSVQVVDVDWHLNGWEGFDWNPKYFPDHADFFKWMHEQGVKIPLNIHPIGPFTPAESRYKSICEKLGWNPATKGNIKFDYSDRKQAQAYLDMLGELMDQGADFWWIDYGDLSTNYGGLTAQWWVNKLVYDYTLQRRGPKDTLIYSRWGGLGDHRYPIGFSGDTQSVWPVLDFETELTAVSGNVGQAYWSHDIGGFLGKKIDPELYTRWVQFGCFSPIMRLHSDHGFRQPWDYDEPYCSIAKKFIKLRESLRPYLVKISKETSETGLPLCRPMYLHYPKVEEAYKYRRQYMLGDDLLVAPIGEPGFDAQGKTIGYKEIWIPEGTWIDYFHNRPITGPTVLNYVCKLDEMPLFISLGKLDTGYVSGSASFQIDWQPQYQEKLKSLGLSPVEITHRPGSQKLPDGTVLPGDHPINLVYAGGRFDFQKEGSFDVLIANLSNSTIDLGSSTLESEGREIAHHDRAASLTPFTGLLETCPLSNLKLDKNHMSVRATLAIKAENTPRKFEVTAQVDNSFIQDWWVIGPFDAPGQTEFDTAFPPEVNLLFPEGPKEIKVGDQTLNWKKTDWQLPIPNDQGDPRFVDMRKLVADKPDIAAYALTYLHSEKDQKVKFKLGSDDSVKVWVNGKEVWKNNVGRPAEPAQDVFEVDLKKGVNPVLVKVCNMSFGWGLYLQVVDLNDKQLTDVIAQHEP